MSTTGMSWEAFRLTSKSPAELYHVLGPHAVDELVRHAMNSCWRQVPEETRTYAAVVALVRQVFDRNMKVWRSIKKPQPAAFFDHMENTEADGLFRQAFILSWMMLPRTGGRKFADTHKIMDRIFQRNLGAWDEDNVIFTKGLGKVSKKRPAASKRDGKAKKAPARKR